MPRSVKPLEERVELLERLLRLLIDRQKWREWAEENEDGELLVALVDAEI